MLNYERANDVFVKNQNNMGKVLLTNEYKNFQFKKKKT